MNVLFERASTRIARPKETEFQQCVHPEHQIKRRKCLGFFFSFRYSFYLKLVIARLSLEKYTPIYSN